MVKLQTKILLFIFLLSVPITMSAQYRWRNVLIADSLSPQNDISAIVFAKNGGMWAGTWIYDKKRESPVDAIMDEADRLKMKGFRRSSS